MRLLPAALLPLLLRLGIIFALTLFGACNDRTPTGPSPQQNQPSASSDTPAPGGNEPPPGPESPPPGGDPAPDPEPPTAGDDSVPDPEPQPPTSEDPMPDPEPTPPGSGDPIPDPEPPSDPEPPASPSGPVPLTCGLFVPGTIDVPGKVDVFSFAGTAGQTINLALASGGGFSTNPAASNSAALTLFAPSGTTVGTIRSNSQTTFALTEAGTYAIRVNATNLGTTGSYRVSLHCLFPTPSPGAVALTCGAMAAGTLSAPGTVDLLTFSAAAGQTINLALASGGGFSTNPAAGNSAALTLFAPSGTTVGTIRSNSQTTFALTEAGTYAIRVNATNLGTTGSYRVSLHCLFPTPSPGAVALTCGAMAAGTLSAPGTVDLLTFSAAAGQTINLALASGGGFSTNPAASNSAALTLFAPSRETLGSIRSNSQTTFALKEPGTYIVRVNAADLGTAGSYNVSVQCL